MIFSETTEENRNKDEKQNSSVCECIEIATINLCVRACVCHFKISTATSCNLSTGQVRSLNEKHIKFKTIFTTSMVSKILYILVSYVRN